MKQKVTKQTYKATIATVSVITGAAVLFIAGAFVGKLFAPPAEESFEEISSDDIVDDQNALMERYNAIKDTASISDFITEFKPYELANIGFNKIADHDFYYSVGIGDVNAMGVKQTIRGFSIKHVDNYFYENLSKSSLVQVAKRFYQAGTNVDLYDGKLKTLDTATWDETSKKTQTVHDYAEEWGKDLSTPCVYTISSTTALETCTSQEENDQIKVELDLHKYYSTIGYCKQMKMTSDLSDLPVFESVHLHIILDNKLNLLENTATEKYKVKKGVWASATGTLRNVCHYDEELAIPDLTTDCIYE